MKKILLLTCGTNACYHIAKILKTKFPKDFKIVGTDINKLWMIPTAPYLDDFFQCPCSTNKKYYPFILDLCKKESIDFILPSFDTDQQLFYSGNPELTALGVSSLGIDESIRTIYMNKEETYSYLNKIGLPTPKCYTLSNVKENDIYFVKPIHGVGSVGAKKMMGKEIKNDINEDFLIQEICFEPEVTLECFQYNGDFSSVARIRLCNKSGVCTKTHIYSDSDLEVIAKKFISCTNLPYIFNLQFMKNIDGEYVITDVNLRSAGGMSLSYAAGWDEVSAIAKIMLGRPQKEIFQSLKNPIEEQYVIRAYTDIVTKKVKRKIAFDFDGTLLDSRLRHSILMSDLLREKNINIDTSDLVSFKSNGSNNVKWLLSKGINESLANEIQKEWIEKIESTYYLKYDKLYPGIYSMLSKLSQNNSLYLVTARSNDFAAREQIESLNISQYFEEIFIVPSSSMSQDYKSNYLISRNIDVMIGDTEIDFAAACKAKCQFRVCLDGFRSRSFWSNKNVIEFNIEDFNSKF